MVASQAYKRSLDMLRRCLSPAGFLASPTDSENYARIWARDGMITSLAALASGDPQLIDGMRRTLQTLARHQGPHGEIPSNVTIDGTQVSFGRLAGRVDAPLWYVLGVCAYSRSTGDTHYQQSAQASVERALFLAGCWEFNNRGLIYTPLSGNWADEYIQQGYVLSDQLLYKMALQAAGTLFARDEWLAKAASLQQLLSLNYWPTTSRTEDRLLYHPHAYDTRLNQHGESEYWLPAFSPAGYQGYFDGLAQALALLTDLGDNEQLRRVEVYVQTLEQQTGSALLPAFWPVIQPGTPEWQLLETNHLYGQLKNQPYMYHNGGLWPFLTGLYTAGLVRHGQLERAEQLLQAINEANRQGTDGHEWEFAEYLHTQSHHPQGTKYLAWSAAAGVIAHQAIQHGTLPFLITS